jgi:hypothetical protein
MFGSMGRKTTRPPDENTAGWRAPRAAAQNSPFGGMLANRGGLLTGKVRAFTCMSVHSCSAGQNMGSKSA